MALVIVHVPSRVHHRAQLQVAASQLAGLARILVSSHASNAWRAEMDWSQCPDVERVPGKVSGAWIVKGTRVQADAIVENAAAGCSAEEIGDHLFPGVGVDRVRRLLTFAKRHEAHPA